MDRKLPWVRESYLCFRGIIADSPELGDLQRRVTSKICEFLGGT